MFREFKSIYNLNWIYVFILLIIFWIGEINLYSAAGGSLDPWASNQLVRFLFFLPLFFLVTISQRVFIVPKFVLTASFLNFSHNGAPTRAARVII